MSPQFAVVIPTYNRPAEIAGCLESLTLIRGQSFEVIVVDDGSREPVADALAGFEGRLDLRVIRQENAGPGAARNRGAEEARAPLVAFTDDDCRVGEGWLSADAGALDGRSDRLAGGPVVNALGDNPYASASQDIITFLYRTDVTDTAFFTSNNFACHRDAFLAAGGFDPELRISSEDRDFCIRWRARGGETVTVPDAPVFHRHDLGLASFWKQHTNYGRGARALSDKLARTGAAQPLSLRGPGFYRDLVLSPYAHGGPKPAMRAALIALSHLAMLRGYFGMR